MYKKHKNKLFDVLDIGETLFPPSPPAFSARWRWGHNKQERDRRDRYKHIQLSVAQCKKHLLLLTPKQGHSTEDVYVHLFDKKTNVFPRTAHMSFHGFLSAFSRKTILATRGEKKSGFRSFAQGTEAKPLTLKNWVVA